MSYKQFAFVISRNPVASLRNVTDSAMNAYQPLIYIGKSPGIHFDSKEFCLLSQGKKKLLFSSKWANFGNVVFTQTSEMLFQKSLKSMYDASHFDLRFGISRNICNKITGQLKEL